MGKIQPIQKVGYTDYCEKIAYSRLPAKAGERYYWGFVVPPVEVPHQKILLLGVCMNTTGLLIQEKYPEAKIDLVDNRPMVEGVFAADAWQFVQATKTRYDYTIVDLFVDGEPPDFVFEEGFYADLSRITKFAYVNVREEQFKDVPYAPYFDLREYFKPEGLPFPVLESKCLVPAN